VIDKKKRKSLHGGVERKKVMEVNGVIMEEMINDL